MKRSKNDFHKFSSLKCQKCISSYFIIVQLRESDGSVCCGKHHAWHTVGVELMLLTCRGRYPLQNLVTTLVVEGNGASSEDTGGQESWGPGGGQPFTIGTLEI